MRPEETARIWASLATLRPDLCRISRVQYVETPGGQAEQETPVADAVSCRLHPGPDGEMAQYGGQVGKDQLAKLDLPPGQDVKAGDNVHISGLVYPVLAIKPRSVKTAFMTQAIVKCPSG